MNKLLFYLLFVSILHLCSQNNLVHAQKPQHVRSCNQGFALYRYTAWRSNPSYFDDTTPRKTQCIYYTRQFTPKVARGYITAVYLKSGRTQTIPYNGQHPRIGYLKNFSISLGWTQQDTFRRLDADYPNRIDTFLPEGTRIFHSDVIRQNLDDSGGLWMRFPVNQNSFYYDTAQGRNLVMTFKFGPPWLDGYFVLEDSCSGPQLTTLWGWDTSQIVRPRRQISAGQTGTNYSFGFDISPTAVESSAFGGEFRVFPNPAHEGMNIRVSDAKALGQISISLRDILGKTVFYTQYSPKTATFETYIPLPELSKGLYFVELRTDKENAVQKVLLE